MKLAPFPSVFICLPIFLICFWFRMVFLRFSILDLPFFLQVGETFSLFLLCGVCRPKLSRLLFKLLLDFYSIFIGHTQGRNFLKLHFILDVSMQTFVVLENHMSLRVFDIDLGAQGMEDIGEL
jgi:hypothetical protein